MCSYRNFDIFFNRVIAKDVKCNFTLRRVEKLMIVVEVHIVTFSLTLNNAIDMRSSN